MAKNQGREAARSTLSSSSSTRREAEALDDADTKMKPQQFLLVCVPCSRFGIP